MTNFKVGDLVTLNPTHFSAGISWLKVPADIVGTIVLLEHNFADVEWSVGSFNPSNFTWSYNPEKLLPYRPTPTKPNRKL